MKKTNKNCGDCGYTSGGCGIRIKKNHKLVKAFAAIDSALCFMGYLKADLKGAKNKKLAQDLTQIQRDMFLLSGHLYGVARTKKLKEAIDFLDRKISVLLSRPKPLNCFVIPGKNKTEALAHIVRAQVRLAEIAVVDLGKSQIAVKYLNRMSKYLFLLAVATGR